MIDFIRVLHGAPAVFFVLGLAVAVVSDLRSFRIPNWIALGLLAAFVLAALAQGWPIERQLGHLAAGAVILVVGLLLYVRGYIHGGDVKLAAAVVVWTGWQHLPSFLLTMAAAGGVLAVALLLFRRWPLPAALAAIPWVLRLHSRARDIPYGVAIAAAGWAVFPLLPIVWAAAD